MTDVELTRENVNVQLTVNNNIVTMRFWDPHESIAEGFELTTSLAPSSQGTTNPAVRMIRDWQDAIEAAEDEDADE